MTKSVTIRARVEPKLKKEGDSILSQLGLSTSDFISMTYRQLVMQRGLPFEARIPNAKTIEAIEEFKRDKSEGKLVRYTGKNAVKDLMKDLLNESDN